MVDSWYCLDRVVPEGMSQISRQSKVAYINSAPWTPGYLLALLRELSQCPRALTEITVSQQVRKMNLTRLLYHFKKRVGKSILTFRTVNFIFKGFRSTLMINLKGGPETPRKRNQRDFRFETWGSIFQPFFWTGIKYHFGSFFVAASTVQFL